MQSHAALLLLKRAQSSAELNIVLGAPGAAERSPP